MRQVVVGRRVDIHDLIVDDPVAGFHPLHSAGTHQGMMPPAVQMIGLSMDK